tara:strand:- start:64 stop:1143 length:1080 start_codon:yes stop_codon:yes gene_type:complete
VKKAILAFTLLVSFKGYCEGVGPDDCQSDEFFLYPKLNTEQTASIKKQFSDRKQQLSMALDELISSRDLLDSHNSLSAEGKIMVSNGLGPLYPTAIKNGLGRHVTLGSMGGLSNRLKYMLKGSDYEKHLEVLILYLKSIGNFENISLFHRQAAIMLESRLDENKDLFSKLHLPDQDLLKLLNRLVLKQVRNIVDYDDTLEVNFSSIYHALYYFRNMNSLTKEGLLNNGCLSLLTEKTNSLRDIMANSYGTHVGSVSIVQVSDMLARWQDGWDVTNRNEVSNISLPPIIMAIDSFYNNLYNDYYNGKFPANVETEVLDLVNLYDTVKWRIDTFNTVNTSLRNIYSNLFDFVAVYQNTRFR